jgi:Na+/melibiose symporter-like transporter
MEESDNLIPENKRPFLLSILCFSVFVYSAVFILIFLATAIFNNWIYYVLNDYLPENRVEKSAILWLSLTGIALYGSSFFGAFLIWRMKRVGLFIFLAASALIALLPFLFGFGSIINMIVFSILAVVFAFFYRKLN